VEGPHDRVFLSEVINRTAPSNISTFFYPNSGTKPEKKDQETVLLRKFSGNSHPYNLLIKEEGGHYFVINLFVNLAVNFLMRYPDISLTVLFDHDRRNPEEEIKKIKNDLKAKTSGKIGFEPISPKRLITDGLHRNDFSLFRYNGSKIRKVTSFSFVGFDVSLEYAVSKFCDKPVKEINQEDTMSFASRVNFKDLIP
jgi:hypothetical protein